MKKIILLASVCLLTNAQAEKWNRGNNPENFQVVAAQKIKVSLSELPLEATLRDDRFGWSDTFWPSNMGGIAYRWNHPDPRPFKYKFLTKEEVLKLSQDELAQLSPAELYDIAMGDYRYSLTRKVLRIYKPHDLWWEGICHGWAQAALNYPEPAKTVVVNKDGIKVPFGSSDVKGLLSMHDAFNSKGFYARVGDRCGVVGKVDGEAYPEDGDISMPNEKDANRPECRDVNAGSFHIVLTNMIGINSQGFVADVDRFNDVWNQPVTGYESKIVGELPLTPADVSNGIHRKLQVKTVMTYGDELEFYSPELEAEGIIGFVSKEPVTGTVAQTFDHRNYEYVLELDNQGNIIGGEWISQTRPDMLWMKRKDPSFRNGRFPLEGLNRIYTPVNR